MHLPAWAVVFSFCVCVCVCGYVNFKTKSNKSIKCHKLFAGMSSSRFLFSLPFSD